MSKFWGSRFEGSTDSLADKFSYSISYDYRLAKYDCIGGIAHAKMLGKCGIIPKADSKAIADGLSTLLNQIEKDTFKYDPKAEDIHTNVQEELKKLIGAPADKLHTARSRNDLIVLDMKLYIRDEVTAIINLISEIQKAVIGFAEENKDVIIPAYTHLQAAQVVLLAHHMLAYVEMLERDKERLEGVLERINANPLGSCALSGTSLPTDRVYVSKQLGFTHTSQNSIESVSDRDFIVETLSALSIFGMHASRIAEDFIIWATSEFNYIDIDWSLCTGSSIMPHKKNPDILELIRGESAKLYGNLTEILVLTKGLPLTYNRDLQLDKPPLFESIEKTQDICGLFTKLFISTKVKKDVLEKRVKDETFFTVDVMEYLIKKGVSYRQAHDTVGKMVKECLDKGINLSMLTKQELQSFSRKFDVDVKKLLKPKVSVKIKKSLGSTRPSLVNKQIKRWKKKLYKM